MTDFLTPTLISTTSQWIVVAKPAGWLTIPPSDATPKSAPEADHRVDIQNNQLSFSAGKTPHILSSWLRERYGSIWIVHRLDRDTSGVVLFARTAADHALVNGWFQNRRTKKIYHCLATGVPAAPILKLDGPIRGSPSLTQVEVLEKYGEGFWAKVLLKTGRRHQIRIHLAEVGHALWGDSQYGGPPQVKLGVGALAIPRVALHASHLELPNGESFSAPLPPDFTDWLAILRKDGTRV